MNLKQVIILRTDLGMQKGKMVAQGAHASLDSFQEAMHKDSEKTMEWRDQGMPKIVLKASSEQELIDLFRHAKSLKLPCALIRDAGHTQVEAGSVTALGIGPDDESRINQITGKLKLL